MVFDFAYSLNGVFRERKVASCRNVDAKRPAASALPLTASIVKILKRRDAENAEYRSAAVR